MARIDDRILRAQLEEARARAELARETFERNRQLYEEEQAISELMVEERIVRLAKLVAQLLGRAEQGRAAEAV